MICSLNLDSCFEGESRLRQCWQWGSRTLWAHWTSRHVHQAQVVPRGNFHVRPQLTGASDCVPACCRLNWWLYTMSRIITLRPWVVCVLNQTNALSLHPRACVCTDTRTHTPLLSSVEWQLGYLPSGSRDLLVKQPSAHSWLPCSLYAAQTLCSRQRASVPFHLGFKAQALTVDAACLLHQETLQLSGILPPLSAPRSCQPWGECSRQLLVSESQGKRLLIVLTLKCEG